MKRILRVIAILSFIVAIIWLLIEPGFEPLMAFLAGITALVTSWVVDKSLRENETFDQRNRRIMLNHVEEFWVKGILKKSLFGEALIDLGIIETPDALDSPWTIKRQSTNETLPMGKPMLEIFEEIGLGRSLLILGAPGSGKTTMLLELTRQLIKRARKDETESVPVVFNLASWTEKQTLAEWLAEQLNVFYYVPKKTALDWVIGNKMFLLLDGLDEVHQDDRSKCVEAINQFHEEHGLTSVVVCSRSQDYTTLNNHLALVGAIQLQPLTQKQVKDYFKCFGKRLAGITQILKKDSALSEMAEMPLFLSIMTLAYQDKVGEDILVSQNQDRQRKYLFNNYIDRMFERPGRTQSIHFNRRNTKYWLSWLASKMLKHNQSPFLLERMQIEWLSTEDQQNNLLLHQGFISYMIHGFSAGLPLCFIFAMTASIANPLINRLLIGLLALILSPIVGLIIAIIERIEEKSEESDMRFYEIVYGMEVHDIIERDTYDFKRIDTVDRFKWSWDKAYQRVKSNLKKGLIYGTITGFLLGLIGGSIIGVIDADIDWLILGLIIGIVGGFSIGLVIGFILGLLDGAIEGIQIVKNSETTSPNQSIRQSFKFASLFFSLTGLIFGTVITYIAEGDLAIGAFGGIGFGLIFGLKLGGYAVIQHYTLRWLLARKNYLPSPYWRLIPFLDYCVDLIFLRRVGGGYIFIHRLMMEHFAELYTENDSIRDTATP